MGPKSELEDLTSAMNEVQDVDAVIDAQTNTPADTTSSDTKEEVSDPATFTQEELNAAVKRERAAQSVADKRAVKAEKELEAFRESQSVLQKQVEDLRKEIEQRELDALDGDDDQLSIVRQRQADRKRKDTLDAQERALAAREKELEGTLEEANEIKKGQAIETIAVAHNVDATELKAKAKKLGVSDPDGIEELAALMAGKPAPGTEAEEGALEKENTRTFRPDSARNVGGKRTKNAIINDPNASFDELEDLLKKESMI